MATATTTTSQSASSEQPIIMVPTTTTPMTTMMTTPSTDLAAATALINHFVHGGNDARENRTAIGASDALDGSDGRTVLHNLVVAAAASTCTTSTTPMMSTIDLHETEVNERNELKLDGLFLIEALCVRMKEMDYCLRTSSSSNNNNHSHNSNSSNKHCSNTLLQSHFHRLLLARDFESGYTPLHHAIYHRDLFTVLLLLGHAADSSPHSSKYFSQQVHLNSRVNAGGGNHSDKTTSHHGLLTTTLLSQSHHHPLQLLNGNLRSSSSIESGGPKSGGGSSCRSFRKNDRQEENDDDDDNDDEHNMAIVTVNKLAASTDHENLTPLQLLGKTSELGLERCRLALYYQRRMRTSSSHSRGRDGQPEQQQQHQGLQRRRRRMISFGDDRDYDALNFAIENEEGDDEGNVNANNNDDNVMDDEVHHGDGFEGQLRRRIRGNSFHDIDLDDDDDDGDHRDNGRDGEDMDTERGDNNSEQHPRRPQSIMNNDNNDEYGCEVLTFGRADHYALGVPQFTTSSAGRRSIGGGSDGKGGSSMMISEASCKPRRVESFALSELRRSWSKSLSFNQKDSVGNITKHQASWDGAVDSPASAIAASTHHTLVLTQSGRLYAFGYGKSGRLGTGDESHRPLPTPIFGQLANRIVVSIAAAENHSLCSTSDGKVFAWGSNSFGQLGNRKDSDPTSITSRLSPRRIEGLLKQSFVVAVAAGERHSVALTKSGEVYCWGDNRSGQLGVYNGGGSGGNGGGAMSSPSTATNNGVTSPSNKCSYGPQRVEGLWSTQPRRRAIAIAAAEFSTLVLTLPPSVRGGGGEASSLTSLPVNCVYGWGHGNHSVTRVVFPTETTEGNANVHTRSSYINPTAIACAKYHNVAITVDGRVFTWGLHSETLGVENSVVLRHADSEWSVASEGRRPRSNSLNNPSSVSPPPFSSAASSSPQLVAGMLPENGGGKAVAVSASESHTAVVTSDGHLFTWGTSVKNNLLGHKGVKWQPSPRKVQRIHRAVGVAAAKEHTVLLMATTFPPLPFSGLDSCNSSRVNQPLTLQECAAIEISRNVDLFNVVPTALVARRLDSRSLVKFCDEFMRKNLDGVLAVGNKNDFASFLSVGRSALVGSVRIGYDRDGTFHPFLYDLANSKTWVDGSHALLKDYAVIPQPNKAKKKPRREKRPSLPGDIGENKAIPTSGNKNCHSTTAVTQKVDTELESKKASSPRTLKGMKDNQSQEQRKILDDKVAIKTNAKDTNPKFLCDVCSVVCPDCDSFTLHMNGRKHRNRLTRASAEEERKVAEILMKTKRMMIMNKNEEGAKDNAIAEDQALEECNKLFEIKTTKSAWANNTISTFEHASERRERSLSFQEILNEQQQKSLTLALNSKGSFSSPTATKRPSGSARAGSTATVHTPLIPNAVACGMKSASPISSPVQCFPLSAYVKKGMERKRVDTVSCVGATWGARQVVMKEITTSDGKGWGVAPANKSIIRSPVTKSFAEIQQEEEVLRSNEDHMCHIKGNHWYVQQRERAASIGEIQEQEQKDREMQLFIEEQKRIENDILSKTKQRNHEGKRDKKKQGRRSRPTNSG